MSAENRELADAMALGFGGAAGYREFRNALPPGLEFDRLDGGSQAELVAKWGEAMIMAAAMGRTGVPGSGNQLNLNRGNDLAARAFRNFVINWLLPQLNTDQSA